MEFLALLSQFAGGCTVISDFGPATEETLICCPDVRNTQSGVPRHGFYIQVR